MSINATQSHSGEHLVAKKAVCNPENMFRKKKVTSCFLPELNCLKTIIFLDIS